MASTTWWDTQWIEYPLRWRTWWPASSMSRGRLMQGPSVDRPLLQVLWWCSPRWTEVLLPDWSMFLLPRWCLLLLWVVCLWWRLLIFLFVVAVVGRWGWWVRCMLWTCISILRSCWRHHRRWVVWFCIGGCSSPDPLMCWLQMLPLLMLDTVTVLPWCLGSFPGDHCSATMLNSLDVFLMLCAADGPTMFSPMAKLKGPRSPDVTRHSWCIHRCFYMMCPGCMYLNISISLYLSLPLSFCISLSLSLYLSLSLSLFLSFFLSFFLSLSLSLSLSLPLSNLVLGHRGFLQICELLVVGLCHWDPDNKEIYAECPYVWYKCLALSQQWQGWRKVKEIEAEKTCKVTLHEGWCRRYSPDYPKVIIHPLDTSKACRRTSRKSSLDSPSLSNQFKFMW